MASGKSMLHVIAALLSVFVLHVAVDSNADDNRTTRHAVTVNANGDDSASIPDFDGDGTVGFGDFVKFAAKWGLGQGDDGYDAQYDLNGDGSIGFVDLLIFAENFGKEAPSPVVTIPDPNLRAAIENALGKTGGSPITQAEMGTLGRLDANDSDISNLTGLEFATNLKYLGLSSWEFDDLPDNNIMDISALAGLTRLQVLALGGNNISDISALANLTDLESLDLQSNSISDISALSDLTKLRWLKLGYNNLTLLDRNLSPTPENSGITDISALSGLTNLNKLELQYNNIADVSALSGLTNLNYLILQVNPIEDISVLSGLTNLESLVFGANDIMEISALSGMTRLRWLVLESNSIVDLSPLAGLKRLRSLDLNRNEITDLSPLSGLTALNDLILWTNNIGDISPLSGLTNLERLNLSSNNIEDISALSGLINLTLLNLDHNRITDISPLRGLTNLTELGLQWNLLLNDSSLNDHIPALKSRGVKVNFTPLNKGDFDIELVFLDPFREDQKDVLRLVARRWMAVIAEDVPDYVFAEGWTGRCGDRSYEITAGERIDDLRIYMTTFDVDDNPNAVGWGGPSLLREQTHRPVLGCMGFDLERANLLITGLHEVGHVLGFGTVWNDLGLIQDLSLDDPNADTHFSGPMAVAAFNDAGGRDYKGAKVPVEKMDGAHWRGGAFALGELMLPWGGGALSAITVQSLGDLGYGVDVSQADPYTLSVATSAPKIAVTTPAVPGFAEDVFRPGIYTQPGDGPPWQGRTTDGLPSIVGDNRQARLESAERMWAGGIKSDFAENRHVWHTGSRSLLEAKFKCGAGLMNEPIYVIDNQGRIVRTLSR